MRHAFYDSEEYKAKQSEVTSRNQKNGVYADQRKVVERVCVREGCKVAFITQPANPKRYCGHGCAAAVSNTGRKIPPEVRSKISKSLLGNTNTQGLSRFDPSLAECENSSCKKIFNFKRYVRRRFCSASCAIRVIGSRPTSPKASRGKAGIRPDINAHANFHSRWEANMARIYTLQRKVWVYEPRTFDIGNQNYTPDFYLPKENRYIEVKNFWNEYSRQRDTKFRARYPNLILSVILKKEYLLLEKQFAHLIPEWEFKNSPFDFLA